MLVPKAEFRHIADQINISIISSKNTFNIELLADSEVLERLSLDAEEFKGCKDGGFIVARSSIVNTGGALGKEWWQFTLYFAPDSLIV